MGYREETNYKRSYGDSKKGSTVQHDALGIMSSPEEK